MSPADQGSAAEPIIGIARKIGRVYDRLNQPTTSPPRQDDSWHDDMVRKANQSFQPKTPPKSVSKSAAKRTSPRAASKRN